MLLHSSVFISFLTLTNLVDSVAYYSEILKPPNQQMQLTGSVLDTTGMKLYCVVHLLFRLLILSHLIFYCNYTEHTFHDVIIAVT